MMLRDDYLVLYDQVEGDAPGQFVWASALEFPQIYQLLPGAKFVETTRVEPEADRPLVFPGRMVRIRRYAGRGDFLTVVAPRFVAAHRAEHGAILNHDERVFCSAAPLRHHDDHAAFEGTAGYARPKQLAIFEGRQIALDGFALKLEGGDFGASADATGATIVGRFAGHAGGTITVAPPAGFNVERAKVRVAGQPVAAKIGNGSITFEIAITQSAGCRPYEIAF
jgi:hypothetical protein